MVSRIPALIATLFLSAMTSAAFAAAPDGGASAEHVSPQGVQNSNGPSGAERDRGLERAEERMSPQGQEHSKAEAKANAKSDAKAGTGAAKAQAKRKPKNSPATTAQQ